MSEGDREPARRLAVVLYWGLVAAVVFSIVGLGLAVIGLFHPALLVLIAVPAAVLLGRSSSADYRRAIGELVHGGVLPVVAVLVILAGSALSASVYAGEHLVTDRDPAIYLTTGRWLAEEGTLLVDGKVGGFEGIEEITAATPGYYETREDGTLDPQFLHLLPVWAAAAHWVGGDQALLRINALVVALALASLWLFASTVLRPWFAVLATASVAVLLPTVHFARDLYSEPLAMLFVFGGLAFLGLARRAARFGPSVIAGVMLAAVTLTRIDGWLVVIAVAGYLMAVWWSAEEGGDQGTIGSFVRPVFLGLLISGAVGLLDGMVRSRPYLVERADQAALMFGLLVAVVLVGLVALRWPTPVRRAAAWFDRNRAVLAWVVPIFIVVVAGIMFLRPFVQETHTSGADPSVEFLQELEGVGVDGTRTYSEQTMRWLSWYLGLFGLGLAAAGMAWAWRRAILGLRDLWPFLLTLSLTTGLYVVRPFITPDQLWAMRRFLPIVLPGLVVAAVLAAQWSVEGSSVRWRRRAALAAAALVLVAVPTSFTWPLRDSTSYVGTYDAIAEVCDAVPADAAILLTTRFGGRLGPALRSFCGVPVAAIPDPDTDPSCVVATADRAWAARGVTLFVGYGEEIDVQPALTVHAGYELPEYTLTRRPDGLTARSFTMNLALADAVDAGACF